jgi:hypothetical protein
MLNFSDILPRFRTALEEAGLDVGEYDPLGDKFYENVQNLHRLYKEPMIDVQRVENTIESSVHIMVEHTNGLLANYWKSLRFKVQQRLRASAIGDQYVVAAVLTNVHTLLYGNLVFEYMFDVNSTNPLQMPTLEDYFTPDN